MSCHAHLTLAVAAGRAISRCKRLPAEPFRPARNSVRENGPPHELFAPTATFSSSPASSPCRLGRRSTQCVSWQKLRGRIFGRGRHGRLTGLAKRNNTYRQQGYLWLRRHHRAPAGAAFSRSQPGQYVISPSQTKARPPPPILHTAQRNASFHKILLAAITLPRTCCKCSSGLSTLCAAFCNAATSISR
jgi:hypothetical protein